MANHTIEIDINVDSDDIDGVADKLKKVENSVKKSMDGSKGSVNQMNNSVSNLDKYFQGINSTASKFGLNSVKTFTRMTNAEKQTALGIIDISENISNSSHAWNRMSQSTLQWADHVKLAQTYVQGLGVETNSLKGKVMTVGLAISSKLGSGIESVKMKLAPLTNAFNPIISRVNSLATNIKTRLGSSIDSVKNKFNLFKVASHGGFEDLKKGAGDTNKSLGLLGATLSNFAGMFLYDFAMGIIQAGKASINAASQLDYFAQRLGNMDGKVKLSGKAFNSFKKDLDGLQKEYRKVDMTAVGASAEELAVKLQLPANSLKGLSETIAVTSSAFVKEGRTQEDAILAVSDALDGQFMKLKELGISQDELKENGWNGDLNDKQSLLEGLNKTLETMGFSATAKDITTLDEAMSALQIAGGQLLQKVLIPLTPILINVVEAFIGITDVIGPVISDFVSMVSSMPDWAKYAILIGGFALSIGLVVSAMGGLTGIMISLGTKIAPLVLAIEGISLPLVAVVAAIGLVAVAVYELGKYFGWWKDVPSMIEAVTGGLKRLWSAFINNPNVQGFIKDLGKAWDGVSEALQPVISWAQQIWNELFPPNAGGEVDVVRMIIDAFGQLGRICGDVVNGIKIMYAKFGILGAIVGIVTSPVQIIVGVLRSIICALLGCSPGIVPALQRVQEVFSSVFSFIAGFIGSLISTIVSIIMTIVTAVQNVINIFSLFLSGQISLTDMVVMLWQNFSAMFSSILNILIGFVSGWGGRIRQIIISTVQGWINNAVNGARNLVNNVHSALSGLPGKVTSALSGITSKFTQPFRDAWSAISPYIDKIKSGIDIISNNMPSFGFSGDSFGFTGESFGWEGIDNLDTLNSTLTTSSNDIANKNNITNNFNINGIIEEEASEYIVGAVNDHIRKQNLIRGV